MFTGLVMLAAVFVLIPGVPLGLVTTAVQALAGVMLPSACLFLLFLCNDRDVLGPWVNRPWFNLLASLILGVLLILSVILVVSTIFPNIDVARLFLLLAAVMVVGLVIAIAINIRARRALPPDPRMDEDRETWRMPSLALLTQPVQIPRTPHRAVRGAWLRDRRDGEPAHQDDPGIRTAATRRSSAPVRTGSRRGVPVRVHRSGGRVPAITVDADTVP